MRLGGRIQAASEVLADIETRKRPAADALKDWGLSHRFAGSGDRAAIGNLVYDVLRAKASLAYHGRRQIRTTPKLKRNQFRQFRKYCLGSESQQEYFACRLARQLGDQSGITGIS